MTTRPSDVRRAVGVASLLVALAGCGADGGQADIGIKTSTEPPAVDNGAPPDVELGQVVTEQDIGIVRAHYDAALEAWQQTGLTDYTLDVSLQTVVMVTIEFVDGQPGPETVIGLSSDDPSAADRLPRSVDAVFDVVDRSIVAFEDDPSLVLPPSDCGLHLNVAFDPELGYPNQFDQLGPCDDGVGIRVEVTAN